MTTGIRLAASIGICIAALAMAGCPLPYKYTPEGYPGTSAGADPSTPDISAAPIALYSQSSGGSGTVVDGQSATTSSDTQVDFSSATVGAVIYYTVDGSTPDPRSPNTRKYAPGSPYKLAVGNPSIDLSSASVTARATAIGPNMKPSLVSTVTVKVQYPRAAAPTFSIESGAYKKDQEVGLSTATPGADIYYTMVAGNGPAPRPTPGQEGTRKYSGPISVEGPNNVWTVSAIAVKDQLIASPAASATYSIAYDACGTPFFTPEGGTYYDDIEVLLRGDENSTIYYTTDGSDPIVGSSPYARPGSGMTLPGTIPLREGRVVLKAVAAVAGKNSSAIGTTQYTFRAARPTAGNSSESYDPATDTFRDSFLLTFSTATSGAIVYYTLDGSDPRTSNTRGYADGPQSLHVSQTTRLRAVAVKDGYLDSEEYDHTFTLRAAIPNFNAAGGVYFAAENIGIVDLTPSATIYFTTDETDPRDESNPARQVYSGQAIPLNQNGSWLWLVAYAHRDGFQDSDIVKVGYFLALPAPKPIVMTADSTTISVRVDPVSSLSAYNLRLYRDASTLVASGNPSLVFTDTGLSPGTRYEYQAEIYYASAGVTVPPTSTASGWTLNPANLPQIVSVTMPGPYATPTGYEAGFLDSTNDGAGYLTTLNAALVDGGYTYIPYSLGDIPTSSWPGSILIVVFDSSNNAVRSIPLSGARYIYSVTMDANGNITYNGQGGQHIMINWSNLRVLL